MNPAAEAILSQPFTAVVAVNRPAGGPQVTPVWFLWDGTAFYFNTTRERTKYNNILRDPSISLLVHDSKGYGFVAAYGQAQTIQNSDPTFADLTTRIVSRYVSLEQVDHFVQPSLAANHVIIKVVPDKIVAPGGDA